jgi:alkanesulfonate monooxygenase SsuD/methylene tetrahydromethanopterin reductase-like flavin-dependent oxidoreductase (luciferase family)
MTRPLGLGVLLPMAGRGLRAAELLAELTEEVVAAEAAGLDLVLVPEHHTGPPGSLTAPLTVTAWLLARTSTIRIGTGVLLLPLHPTVRVAEEASLLQQASGGRLVLGVGAGYQSADFDLFGVDRRQRTSLLEEGLADLRAIWAGQPIVGTVVRPSLDGTAPPPLWLGAWSPAGARRAAKLADGWVADPVRTSDEVAAMATVYRDAAANGGGSGQVVVMREGFVGTTTEAARVTYGPAVSAVYRYYLRNGAFPAHSRVSEGDLTLDGALRERVVVGSSSEVAERLAQLVERTRADTVVLALRHPSGPGHDDVLAAIRRLGTEVRPLLQERLASTKGTA